MASTRRGIATTDPSGTLTRVENTDPLAALDFDVDPDALRDEHGFPVGEQGREILHVLMGQLEETVEAGGWDQPMRVFLLYVHADPSGPPTIAAIEQEPVTGHPVDQLWGIEADPDAFGLVAVFEGWQHDGGARIEGRHALALTRSNLHAKLARRRGSSPERQQGARHPEGFVPDMLRATMGLPTYTVPEPVVSFLARAVALGTLHYVSSVLQDPALMAEIDSLHEQREEGLRVVTARATVDIATDLAAHFTGTDPAELAIGDSEHGAAPLVRAAMAAAAMTWDEVLARPDAVSQLPPPLPEHAAWAGPALTGAFCTHRLLPEAEVFLKELQERAGAEVAGAVRSVLGTLTWLPTPEQD